MINRFHFTTMFELEFILLLFFSVEVCIASSRDIQKASKGTPEAQKVMALAPWRRYRDPTPTSGI
jgi:hypothetical protein